MCLPEALLEASLSNTVGLWRDRAAAHAFLLQRLQERLELFELNIAEARHAHFGLAGVEPADYLERWLELPGAGPLLAGIRFRNLDPGFPFLELQLGFSVAVFFVHFEALKSLLQQTFAVFQPRGFSLQVPASLAVPVSHKLWNLTFVGQPAAFALPDGFVLKAPSSENLAADYSQWSEAYRSWQLTQPQLQAWVSFEPLSTLQQAQQAGLLFYLCHDQVPIGLIAGERTAYFDRSAVLMLEEFILPTYQGQGLGACMQSAFFQQIQAAEPTVEVLWGTIFAGNTASQKTAARCGRQPWEKELFFSF